MSGIFVLWLMGVGRGGSTQSRHQSALEWAKATGQPLTPEETTALRLSEIKAQQLQQMTTAAMLGLGAVVLAILLIADWISR